MAYKLPFKHPDLWYWLVDKSDLMNLTRKVRNTSTCYKQKVGAVISDRLGVVLAVGTNSVRNPQDFCPRQNHETGTGYELCAESCGGNLHAEIAALNMLTEEDEPYGLHLFGHWWICENCANAIVAAGIKNVYLHPSDGPDTDWSKV